MDATTRWETEAIRAGAGKRANPPRPTSKASSSASRKGRTWLTLKEAEEATGIPSNTLRKWVRRGLIDTRLESDGEIALRMVELGSVRARAEELGREIRQQAVAETPHAAEIPESTEIELEVEPLVSEPTPAPVEAPAAEATPPGTMLVPIDAWNKMLNQLGNLHEAGQQLAEARERAAKAETEATFLRERLKEMRAESAPPPTAPITWDGDQPAPPNLNWDGQDDVTLAAPIPPTGSVVNPQPATDTSTAEPKAEPDTTTYWRYLTTGWRDRKRRSKQ